MSLPAIDLFSAPEPPRAAPGRDRGAANEGGSFALELEKAKPATDEGTRSTDDDAGAAHAKDARNADRDAVDATADDVGHERDREDEAPAKETDANGSRTDARHDGAEDPVSVNPSSRSNDDGPTTDAELAPEARASTPSATTPEPTGRVANATDVAVLVALPTEAAPSATDAGSSTDARPAGVGATAARPTSTDPAATAGAPADARSTAATRTAEGASTATPSESAANADPNAPTTDATATRATADAAPIEATRSNESRKTAVDDAPATRTRQDAGARERSADADFSGLNDDSDVRALLAQHAEQQRRVAAIAPGAASFERTHATRARTQEVVRERSEQMVEATASNDAARGDDTRDAPAQSDARTNVPETTAAARSTPAQPALPTRGSDPAHPQAAGMSGATAPTASIARGPAAPTATPPVSVPHAVPIQAILAQVRAQVRGGAQSIHLQLDPAELGRLTLRFRMDGDQLHVAVRASRIEVVEALRADLSAFSDTLRDAGIDPTRLDIDLAAPRDGDSASAFADLLGDSDAESRSSRTHESSPADAAAPARSRIHDGLVDVLA